MSKLILFFGMALVTFLTRYTMIALLGKKLPLFILKFLNYIPVAILTALIVPFIFTPQGKLEINNHFWAFLIALLIAWRTKQVILTLIGGMTAYWILCLIGI